MYHTKDWHSFTNSHFSNTNILQISCHDGFIGQTVWPWECSQTNSLTHGSVSMTSTAGVGDNNLYTSRLRPATQYLSTGPYSTNNNYFSWHGSEVITCACCGQLHAAPGRGEERQLFINTLLYLVTAYTTEGHATEGHTAGGHTAEGHSWTTTGKALQEHSHIFCSGVKFDFVKRRKFIF